MELIVHRINTITELKKVPKKYGVEIDIRSHSNRLILHHEPFCKGTDFEEWLEYYDHQFLVLNIKEEGLEKGIKTLIDKKGITDYFYVDLSFPFLVKLINAGEKNIAVRFSEYESIETCLSLACKVDWVWVDCFNSFPLTSEAYKIIKKNKLKICIVSPELLGRENEINSYIDIIQNRGFKIDAVCSKISNYNSWNNLIQ